MIHVKDKAAIYASVTSTLTLIDSILSTSIHNSLLVVNVALMSTN